MRIVRRPQNLELRQWWDTATYGLCGEARQRIADEIENHYTEAVHEELDNGQPARQAHGKALAALGDPCSARKAFRRTYLTGRQEKALMPKPKLQYVPSLICMLVLLVFGGFVTSLEWELFMNGPVPGYIAVELYGHGILCFLFPFCACTDIIMRQHLFRRFPRRRAIVRYIVFRWLYSAVFVTALACLLPLVVPAREMTEKHYSFYVTFLVLMIGTVVLSEAVMAAYLLRLRRKLGPHAAVGR